MCLLSSQNIHPVNFKFLKVVLISFKMPPKSKPVKHLTGKKVFKWTSDRHIGMAEYVRSNYDSYKTSLGSQKKMAFLRKLKEELKLECTDQQLKNGFSNFLKKYSEIKMKLNASGFGIDPEKDASLEEGWILKVCPYFKILDEVMGTRPNVAPPYLVSTSEENEVRIDVIEDDEHSSDLVEDGSPITIDVPEVTDEALVDEGVVGIGESTSNKDSTSAAATTNFVKQAFSGLNLEKDARAITKNPLGVYTKVMGERVAETSKIEREKMEMQKVHFEIDRDIKNERNRIELIKVNSQIEIENKRLDLEHRILADKEAERTHEIQKMKIQHEFELKKLQLLRQSQSD